MNNYKLTTDDLALLLKARKRFDTDVAEQFFYILKEDYVDKIIGFAISELLEDINLHSQSIKFLKVMGIRYRDPIKLVNRKTRPLNSMIPDKTISYITNILGYDVYLINSFISTLRIHYDYALSEEFQKLTSLFQYHMQKTLRL